MPGTPTPTTASRAKSPSRPTAPQVGEQLAQYRILKVLGEGGMGLVYKGWDVHLRRAVALKVLRPEVATDATARSRFIREARAAAAVQHDNVVTIHQVGEHNGVPFIAMQYLLGTTLDRYLASRNKIPLDPLQAMRIGREIADGLAAAHALGLTHRDIKPSNVWLEAPKGRVKLLDFGIAKLNRPETDIPGLTEPGIVMGTPAYMSPEQARGWPIDSRADLFSLGAVLYQLCTGVTPFARATAIETLTALATDAPVPITDHNPTVPTALAALVEQMLAKAPDARPQTANEVVVTLRRIEREWVMARRGATPREGLLVLPAAVDDPGYEVVEDELPAELVRRSRRKSRPLPSDRVIILAAIAGVAAAVGTLGIAALVHRLASSGAPTLSSPVDLQPALTR